MSLNVSETIKTSWQLVHGNKLAVFASFLMMTVIIAMLYLPVTGILQDLNLVPSADGKHHILTLWFNGLIVWLFCVVLGIFSAGFIEIGIKRMKGIEISPFEVILHSHHWLVVANLLILTFILKWFTLAYLPPYSLIAVYFLMVPILAVALPVATHCDTNTFHALSSGLVYGLKHCLQIWVLKFTVAIATILACIPLGVGLLWVLPFKLNIMGSIYKTFEAQGAFDSFKEKDRYLVGEVVLAFIFITVAGFLSLKMPHHPASFLTDHGQAVQTDTGLSGNVIKMKR